MFDRVWVKMDCPYCGENGVIELQTKDLSNCLDDYEVGDKVPSKFNELDCVGDCHSLKCQEFADKRDIIRQGCPSGFGRLFNAKVKVEKGKITGKVTTDTSEHETDSYVDTNKKKWLKKYNPEHTKSIVENYSKMVKKK